MKKSVTEEMAREFINKSKAVKTRQEFRFNFFDVFPVSYVVPPCMFNFFRNKIIPRFYDHTSTGYNGILSEIDDRIEIAKRTGKDMTVNDFLKHTDRETDFYDPSIGKAFEKKTGCGDWLTDKNATTLEKAVAIYKRKRRLIRWDYDFVPVSEDMNGKKSVKKTLSEEQQKTQQERTKKTKKDGSPVINKQYPVHIHIETTYNKFFEYLSMYPSGMSTFFKLSTRSTEEGSVSYVWQMQTIKNSKKKIDFLEHFNTWVETGLTLEEYKAQQETEEE